MYCRFYLDGIFFSLTSNIVCLFVHCVCVCGSPTLYLCILLNGLCFNVITMFYVCSSFVTLYASYLSPIFTLHRLLFTLNNIVLFSLTVIVYSAIRRLILFCIWFVTNCYYFLLSYSSIFSQALHPPGMWCAPPVMEFTS